jgi:hypothetical protein
MIKLREWLKKQTIKKIRTKSENQKYQMRIKLKENFNCIGYSK